ncbi:MAG: response regulator transcription factor [Flavobacterium lindanitolerans]|jgi:DNA-binding NarL/FixJ family response regulator|uniref:Response regulator transcription factor n=1 Tax=Flavobacterium microcysteis TaxID=2596891 RepID=A0A501Q0U4_9FLAO|nr:MULTISPECIES: response regulator transcription factor [Flavobacterium]MBL7869785.1 response regulator transcription factor [Flavobacterium lindanitolerans]MDL2143484.1 response regulator transcription factor [Flavobacterium tructae]TPD65964.1 response regulator transcription factor [Flavobacterium microcysteis]
MEKENQITIALIDDHEGLRISLQNFLEYSNFKVVLGAANGQEAIDNLQIQEVLPDICILDINMPLMDGYQTAKELAESYPEIKILVFSSLDNKKSIIEMLSLGVRGYVLKGSAPEKLKKAVIKLDQGEYYFSETISKTALSYLAENQNFH